MEANLGSWGVIVRDDSGNIVASAWSPIKRCCTPGEAEAIAALEGIRSASKLNTPIIPESDCQSVVSALTCDLKDRSQASFVFTEARMLAREIPRMKIKKIQRTANRAAHIHAAYCRSTSCSGVSCGAAPDCVIEQASRDCNPDTVI
jgi:ribonuclease HI